MKNRLGHKILFEEVLLNVHIVVVVNNCKMFFVTRSPLPEYTQTYVVLHFLCVCMCLTSASHQVGSHSKTCRFFPSVLSAGIEGRHCHRGALYIIAESAPNVTWLAAWMKERLEGHLLPNGRPPVRVRRLATNIIEDRLGGSGPHFKDVRVIKPKVGHLLAPLGSNFKRVSVSLTWMVRFVLESALG